MRPDFHGESGFLSVGAMDMEKNIFTADAFAGKTVLISGGTSGIGLACAKLFLAGGARVVLVGRDEERGHAALAGLSAGQRALFVPADVRRRADCARMVEETICAFGTLDVLIHSAGIYAEGALDDLGEDALEDRCVQKRCAAKKAAAAALPQASLEELLQQKAEIEALIEAQQA